MESLLSLSRMHWEHELVRLVAADVSRLKFFQLRMSGLTSAATRFMESPLSLSRMHLDHEPIRFGPRVPARSGQARTMARVIFLRCRRGPHAATGDRSRSVTSLRQLTGIGWFIGDPRRFLDRSLGPGTAWCLCSSSSSSSKPSHPIEDEHENDEEEERAVPGWRVWQCPYSPTRHPAGQPFVAPDWLNQSLLKDYQLTLAGSLRIICGH